MRAKVKETPESLETLLSLGEIAAYLGVGRRTVERWRAGGVLPKPDLERGRVKRWKPSTLASWLAAAKPQN